jgi:AraC family transcriptional regulator
VIVTTQFPDLPPTPETAQNAGFRRRFFSRWGRENSVFVASTRQAAYGPISTALSFKAVLRGSAALTLGRRRLVMEPGFFLLVNAGDEYSVAIDSPTPVHCFSLHFQPEMARDVAGARSSGWTAALDGEQARTEPPRLREALIPIEAGLQEMVQHLSQSVHTDQPDSMALEQDFMLLLQRLLQDQAQRRQDALAALPAARAATRLELLRRVDWAADYMLSNYPEPITLDDIADAARLSKYHLLRAFQQVKRCTPHQFLRARRVDVARRLLDNRELDLPSVAAATGFGSRWTLQRALRLHLGVSGARLREATRG